MRVSQIWEIGCVGDLDAAAIMQETWPVTVRFLLMNMRQINCNMRLKISAMRQDILRWTRPEVLPRTLVKPSIASGNIAVTELVILTSLKLKNPKPTSLLPKH